VDAAGLFEAVPNFSEGRRDDVIGAIVGGAHAAHLLDADADPDHNRVVVSIAGEGALLAAAVMGAVGQAVERIDIRTHQGVHPRVGVADVVPIIPLGGETLDSARMLAREIGERIWSELHVPVYFYGHGTATTLADVRAGRARLDLGGPALHPSAGAACVGTRGPLVAFNVLLPGRDAKSARALARSLRESAGGMRGVQALVFELPGGRVQLSTHLFRLGECKPADLVAELERRGVELGRQEVVGLCPAAAALPAAAGRVLEARLAGAASRAGAVKSRHLGGEEHVLLARRLESEAQLLDGLGVDQEALLSGAERAAALKRVLRAGQALDRELGAMLDTAAAGLRSALSPATVAAHRLRIAALDA
jgi:glutamate formiminotransferase / 5-formyltetrahydrofolate cyclo-ligase